MRKKALLLLGLSILIVFGIGITTSVLILNVPDKPDEPDEPDEPIDPYVKGWGIMQYIVFISSNDYFFVNYTIPPNYTYRYLVVDVECCAPYIYAVSSEMFEVFCEAAEEGYIYNNPIVESVYQFERYDEYWRFNIYGNFVPPYLANWYIFYCACQGGRTAFNFADAIFDRILSD